MCHDNSRVIEELGQVPQAPSSLQLELHHRPVDLCQILSRTSFTSCRGRAPRSPSSVASETGGSGEGSSPERARRRHCHHRHRGRAGWTPAPGWCRRGHDRRCESPIRSRRAAASRGGVGRRAVVWRRQRARTATRYIGGRRISRGLRLWVAAVCRLA